MLGRGGILLCPRGFPAVTVRLKLRDGAAKSPCTCGLDSEIYNTELPSRARAVYMYLRDRGDSQGKCWPGIKTIASDMRLSRSTVKRALTVLEQHGYLQKIPRYRDNGSSTSNLYSVQ